MPPDNSRDTGLNPRQRSHLRPTASSAPQNAGQQAAQEATAGIVRSQIENIFQQNTAVHAAPATQQAESQPTATATTNQPLPRIQAASTSFSDTSHTSADSPYDRTHTADRTDLQANQWKQYHSAWQDYYRQYYERYYIGEVYRMHQTLDAHTTPAASRAAHEKQAEELSENDEAFHNLRTDLLRNVRNSAVKVRSSRHFMPFVAAGLTMVLFLFVQFNRIPLAFAQAYVSPGNVKPASIIIDPNQSVPISNEPRLIIPKINVDVPVVYDTTPDQASQLRAMEGGVAWFGIPGANSKPGQVGNTALAGHSSNDLFDTGEYKFIFARLEQLVEGDVFYANFEGRRFTYSITKKEVVKPTDVQKLVYPTDKPIMTLITCVPLGTDLNRLLVTAEQISPNPLEAPAAPEAPEPSEDAAMPGNTPSILSRLFGG